MHLPPLTTPEGLLDYLLALIILAALLFGAILYVASV